MRHKGSKRWVGPNGDVSTILLVCDYCGEQFDPLWRVACEARCISEGIEESAASWYYTCRDEKDEGILWEDLSDSKKDYYRALAVRKKKESENKVSDYVRITRVEENPITGEVKESDETFDLLTAYREVSNLRNRVFILEEVLKTHIEKHRKNDLNENLPPEGYFTTLLGMEEK